MLTLLYYKGFSVVRTMSIEETSEMILQMCDKIGREKTKKSAFYSLQNSSLNITQDNILNNVQSNTTEIDSEYGKITNLNLVIEPKSIDKRYSEVVKKVKKEVTSTNDNRNQTKSIHTNKTIINQNTLNQSK